MAVFSSRPTGYKVGVVGLVLSFVLFVVGFASPYWTSWETVSYSFNQGLWVGCSSAPGFRSCGSYHLGDLPAWFHAVRACEAIGLVCLCMGLLFGLCANCRAAAKPYSRSLESLSSSGGICALVGTIVFMVRFKDSLAFEENVYSWALYLAIVGSGGSFIAAVIISVFNKPLAAGTAVAMQTASMNQMASQQQQEQRSGFQSPAVVYTNGLQAGPYPPPPQGPPAYPSAPPTSMIPPQSDCYPPAYSPPSYDRKY